MGAVRVAEPEGLGLGGLAVWWTTAGRTRLGLGHPVDLDLLALLVVVADVADVERRATILARPNLERLPIFVVSTIDLEGSARFALLVQRVDGRRVPRVVQRPVDAGV